jgi:two-component system phosphate regulon response regulator PhoB
MPANILIIEDEADVREMIGFTLKRQGFNAVMAENSSIALKTLGEILPDLILLDWMLPDISGVDLARRLKDDERYQDIPIIMLTARGEEDDKIRGLDSGADDYITKPFSPRELGARINAVLRRTSPAHSKDIINISGLELDQKGYRVHAGPSEINLGPTEFKLLQFLMAHPERVFSRTQLLDRIWGSNVYIEERTVDVHIRRLRKALEPVQYDRMIQTVRGAGYRLSAEE